MGQLNWKWSLSLYKDVLGYTKKRVDTTITKEGTTGCHTSLKSEDNTIYKWQDMFIYYNKRELIKKNRYS